MRIEVPTHYQHVCVFFVDMLQVQLVDIFNSIFIVIYFSICNHTACVTHNELGYGVQEYNAVDVYEVTEQV